MSNETIPVIPNDEEQRSLRGSGLILAAATDDSDFTKTKEGYAARLEGILDTPLTPENFSTYADDAYNQVVSLVGDMVSKSPYRDLPLPSRLIEDYAGDSYGIDIGKVLDTLISKVEETSDIKKFVANTGRDNDVYVPPQVLSPKIESGKGEFTEAGVSQKLESILFLLKEIHGIDLQDSEQIVVTRGAVDKNMMRNEPYYSIEIPGLNRTILVCNEKGNITYILDSEILAESMPNFNLEITDLDKGAIDQLIKDNPSLGARIQHTVKYLTKIEDSLYEIANFNEATIDANDRIQEVSLLADAEKATEGYLSTRVIAKNMGIDYATLRDIISKLGEELGDVETARHVQRGRLMPSFSPEQIEMMRAEAESRGLFKKPLEGYLSVKVIARGMGIGDATLRDIISKLGEELGDVETARHGKFLNVSSFSPEQIEMMRAEAESRGYFKKPLEGYLSAHVIAQEMGIGDATLIDIISKLGEELGDVETARHGQSNVPSFSPEQIEMMRAEAESRGYFTDAPEGYLTITGIIEVYGIRRERIRKIIGELGDDFGKALNAKNKYNRVGKWFSPEQIEMIRAEAKKPKPTE